MIKLFTIGFTKKSAEQFFDLLVKNGVKRIVDTRINHSSQLSGFAKSQDLKYFAMKIAGIEYVHVPEFAPTEEMLSEYRKKKYTWQEYEGIYRRLLAGRDIKKNIVIKEFDKSCLLCSEDTPDKCHRRLLAEYLKELYDEVEIIHLI